VILRPCGFSFNKSLICRVISFLRTIVRILGVFHDIKKFRYYIEQNENNLTKKKYEKNCYPV
jgi:hypothetical protein